jgi:mannose-6-phosphate isomerase-like protein (cupin superfamily)
MVQSCRLRLSARRESVFPKTHILRALNRERERRSTLMPTLIASPTRIEAAGNKPKLIDEFIGRVNSRQEGLSIAHMRSPVGWVEPGQTPEFEEYTIVLKGLLRVEYTGGQLDVKAGQAVIAHAGEWVQYSTPGEEGAEYLAICMPAFSPTLVHRDDDAE